MYGYSLPKKPENNCPTCEREPKASRWKAGEKNWICGSGHNWTVKDLADKAKRDEAKANQSRR